MSANGLMQQQLRLEELFNKNQVVPRIRAEFEQSDELYEALRVFNIPKKLGVDMMTYMVILKRLEVSALIGLLRHTALQRKRLLTICTRLLKQV